MLSAPPLSPKTAVMPADKKFSTSTFMVLFYHSFASISTLNLYPAILINMIIHYLTI